MYKEDVHRFSLFHRIKKLGNKPLKNRSEQKIAEAYRGKSLL